jgi:hypothetical protein
VVTPEHTGLAQLLETQRTARLAGLANRHYHAMMMARHHNAVAAPDAGGPGAPAPADSGWDRKHAEALAEAELDLVETFARQNCLGNADPAPLCQDLRQQAVELRHKAQALASSTVRAQGPGLRRSHAQPQPVTCRAGGWHLVLVLGHLCRDAFSGHK